MPELSRSVEETLRPTQASRAGRNSGRPGVVLPVVAMSAHRSDTPEVVIKQVESPLLTTPEAAAYLRRSVTWLLRQGDIPYIRGVPNLYRRVDLDRWIEDNLTTQDF